jgi:hypothetical protein
VAITTMDGLVAAIAAGQRMVWQKASVTTVAAFYYSLWSATGAPGAGSLTIGNTTSGLIPTDTTAGAPVVNAFTGANTGYLSTFDCSLGNAGVLSIYDRLFHVGSVSCTSLATTTLSSQPSFAGRVPNSDWSQLELWLEVNAAVSATATTCTVSYQDGSNTTQTATLDSNLSGLPTMRMLPFRLANATGIRQVNSITIGGTVASTGSINVIVQRNIVDHTVVSTSIARPKKNAFDTGLPIIYADSCLAAMVLATTTSSGVLFAEGTIING